MIFQWVASYLYILVGFNSQRKLFSSILFSRLFFKRLKISLLDCPTKKKILLLGLTVHLIFPAHPWVREGGDASDIPIDISVLNNMRQFVRYSRLKQFALRVRSFFLLFGEISVQKEILSVIKLCFSKLMPCRH